jgi:hypothetical protein
MQIPDKIHLPVTEGNEIFEGVGEKRVSLGFKIASYEKQLFAEGWNACRTQTIKSIETIRAEELKEPL